MTMVNCYPEKMNLSFSGCGFLCIYHAGVAAAIKEYAPQLIANKISGASAGAIVAAGLISGVCISEATSTILKVVTQARSRTLGPMHPAFSLLDIVRSEIHRTLPPDTYKKCTGRLQISLTRWKDNTNVIVDEYDSNDELIDAIICSCFIPGYCGMTWLPKYRGVAYIDGGITDNQPAYDDHTVTVSPFSGESDICPMDDLSGSFFGISFSKTNIRFTTDNLYRLSCALMPPSTENCANMCVQGFRDAIRFLTNTGLAPCINCMTMSTDVNSTPGKVKIPMVNRGFSPLNPRTRSHSITPNRRDRLESERETCCENSGAPVIPSLPKIMQDIFTGYQDAFHTEKSYFSFLWEFRVLRWSRTAIGVGKLPWDTFVVITKSLLTTATHMAAPDWLVKRYAQLSEFILRELDTQKVRYSMYSCQLELTQFDQKKHIKEHKMTKFMVNKAAKEEAAVLRAKDKGKKKEPEAKPSSSNSDNSDFSHGMDWSGKCNLDSYEHLVDYSDHHDSLYEFHYMDENNISHTMGLFNMLEDKKHPCHSHNGGQKEAEKTPKRPVSMVLEEDEECVGGGSASTSLRGDGGDEVDSGLSGVEQSTIGKRDACCSPVHDFPVVSTSHRAGTLSRKSSVRRHPPTTPASVNNRRSLTRDAAVSSDSEVDGGECLFIPDRAVRRASNEYDGEPEPSD